jgi:signal transduction histidine kinase
MKNFIKIALLILLPVAAIAQDTVITITPDLFNNKKHDAYQIVNADGWLFKQGNDTSWARRDIDTKSWQKMSPTKLTAKYADKTGRAEGWFRLKFKLADSFTKSTLGLKSAWWAAEDIYVDGLLVTSYGNTGVNGKPYHEAPAFNLLAKPIPINFKPGTEHTIAVHFVDYTEPLPPLRLKSEDTPSSGMVFITLEDYNNRFLSDLLTERSVEAGWVAVCTVLCLLFWLLYFQNQAEKSFKTIALYTMFLALLLLSALLGTSFGISFLSFYIFTIGNEFFVSVATVFTLLVVVNVFGRKVTKALNVFLGTCFIAVLVNSCLFQNSLVMIMILIMVLVLNIYYIVSSWKNLRGPQWAIVIGLIVSQLFGGIYFFLKVIFNSGQNAFLTTVTGYSLSFPLSLLVYVSMRFKEIITEVRANAAQVVQLSEEKEQEALNRQQVLEQEVNRQTAEIRLTLDNLKSTQTQLVQREKMASLGELTAGIAHEIQNPLNFVNNFSEVNKEMLDELDEELDKGDIAEAKAIASDIRQNEEKINHHGKRADFIVKGMLQHSRTSTGEKQLTNINILADEFLKLSYHGLRAKDKNFNAEMITRFDETLTKVNIAQQDIGRVLLNLFNNAFYAVNQKQKTAGPGYKPAVTVSTSAEKNNLIIKVKDNGDGIPGTIKDKIMQPFFTTKPTGEGTGLGLSLSYDIVVKGHKGSINVESNEGQYSEFTVTLPL